MLPIGPLWHSVLTDRLSLRLIYLSNPPNGIISLAAVPRDEIIFRVGFLHPTVQSIGSIIMAKVSGLDKHPATVIFDWESLGGSLETLGVPCYPVPTPCSEERLRRWTEQLQQHYNL